jgi:hypothetical protein
MLRIVMAAAASAEEGVERLGRRNEEQRAKGKEENESKHGKRERRRRTKSGVSIRKV